MSQQNEPELTLAKFGESALAIPSRKATPKMISTALAGIHAGSKSYGKQANGALLQAWTLALTRIEATAEELFEASAHFLINDAEFPAAADVCQFVLQLRAKAIDRAEQEAHRARIQEEREERAADQERRLAEFAAENGMTIEEARANKIEITKKRLKDLMENDSPYAISRFGGKAFKGELMPISVREKEQKVAEFRKQLAQES